MTGEHSAGAVARWSRGLGGRVARAWRHLPHERRLAAASALGLFVTLFLPWYQETVIVPGVRAPTTASTSITGWGAFSFVEAAVLLIAAGVLTLLLHRAEGRAFHLPGGDGLVIMAAGAWTCVLVIWRIFDKQSTSIHGPGAAISGVEWGIFAALGVAALLAYAGSRMRAAHRPEPPLPGESAAGTDSLGPSPQVAEPEPEPRQERPREARTSAQPPAAGQRSRASEGATDGEFRASAQRARGSEDEFRPPGWLTARPKHLDEETELQPNEEQLTIPLEHED
jgi:hypothetical protein